MILITKRKQVGRIGYHKIYEIQETYNCYIPHASYYESLPPDEEKYRSLFFKMNLNKEFYFSYTYELSSTLQKLVSPEHAKERAKRFPNYNEMFVWNAYLMEKLVEAMDDKSGLWLCPIIHGYFVQKCKLTCIFIPAHLCSGGYRWACYPNDVDLPPFQELCWCPLFEARTQRARSRCQRCRNRTADLRFQSRLHHH